MNARCDTLAPVSIEAGLRAPAQPNVIREVIREGLEHVGYVARVAYFHVEPIYLKPGEPEPDLYPSPWRPNWRGRPLAFTMGLVIGLGLGWLLSRS